MRTVARNVQSWRVEQCPDFGVTNRAVVRSGVGGFGVIDLQLRRDIQSVHNASSAEPHPGCRPDPHAPASVAGAADGDRALEVDRWAGVVARLDGGEAVKRSEIAAVRTTGR